MKIKRKNGFTIVELVIVIAVIAILAAILVPTISKLVKKAHVTSDTQLVRNLNTSLAMDTSVSEHTTMQEALNAAAAYGYDVGKINASATDNMILWDSVNDVFCYRMVDDDGNVSISYIPNSVEAGKELDPDSYKLWIISDQVHPNFSTYYTGTASTINTSKGFDAGSTTSIENINYTKGETPQDVVIRTNGGSLTVNADTDTVKHYGIANKVDIQAIKSTSYVENGVVSIAKIKTGRIVLTPQALVVSLHVVETNGNYVGIKVAVVGNAQLPAFTRDDVTLNNGDKKLVIEVQSIANEKAVDDSPEYIWISRNDDTTSTDVASSGTTLNESTIVPPASQSAVAQTVADNTEDGTTAEELEAMETVATRYAGGQGTESNPYLLATKAHFGSIDEDYHNGESAGKYYKLVADLDLGKIYPIGSMSLSGNAGSASQGYTITYSSCFMGNIDGANHAISYTLVADEGLAGASNSIGLFGAIEDSVIKNLTINANVTSDRSATWVGGLAGFGWGCTLENVTMNGSVVGAHDVGGFFGYYSNEGITTSSESSVTFKNCVNNATVVCNSKRTNAYAICGGFIGQFSPDDSRDFTMNFVNCKSNGSISIGNTAASNNAAASYFIGFGSDNVGVNGHNITVNFTNCTVGADATFASTIGYTKTISTKTIYCGSSAEAIAACPAIKYVGVTSKLWSAQSSTYTIIVDNAQQDVSKYFVE